MLFTVLKRDDIVILFYARHLFAPPLARPLGPLSKQHKASSLPSFPFVADLAGEEGNQLAHRRSAVRPRPAHERIGGEPVSGASGLARARAREDG